MPLDGKLWMQALECYTDRTAKSMKITDRLMSVLAVLFFTLPSFGAPVTKTVVLAALDSGWYSGGTHIPDNKNYLTGLERGGEYQSFFVFDLSEISGRR